MINSYGNVCDIFDKNFLLPLAICKTLDCYAHNTPA